MEFNKISHMKIFLVALFHTKHFRPQAARVRTFLTLLHSIFLLVFFYVANSSRRRTRTPQGLALYNSLKQVFANGVASRWRRRHSMLIFT
jgi:hypothetical protein